jgi:hypothetical protein
VGEIISATGLLDPAARYVWFSVFDSGQPGGAGDLFVHEAQAVFDIGCRAPVVGFPITHGNILVKADLP